MRIWKIISWVVSTAIMLAALVFAGFTFWAISGTRDLSKYNNYVEESVNAKLTGEHVKIGSTNLSWGALDELLAINVSDVALLDDKNKQLAYFPKVVLRYNFFSLLRGELTPSVIKLVKPEIDLTGMDFAAKGGSKLDLNKYNIDKFDSVIIENGNLTAPDGEKWQVINAHLRYANDYIYTNGELHKVQSSEIAKLSYYTNLDQSDKGFKANLSNFDSYELRTYLPEAGKARVMLNGAFNFVSNAKQSKANFNFISIKGEVNDLDLFDDKFTIINGKAAGSYDLNNDAIDVSNVEMLFGDGFKVQAHGSSQNFKAFNIEANMSDLPIISLVKFWPKAAMIDAIPWLKTHVSNGVVTSAEAYVKISPEEIANHKLAKNSVNLKFAFKDVDLKYSDKLTEVKNSSGTGVVDGDSVKIKVDSGTSGNTKLDNATAEIRDIGAPAERLYVTANTEGDAADLAEFYLNTGSGNKIIASKEDVAGSAVSEAEVNLPLAKDLHLDDVKYHVRSKVTNASARNFANKFDIANLNCMVEADNDSYHIAGQSAASYNKPNESFALTAAPVMFDVISQNSNLKIDFASDITGSTITLAPLEIVKKAGEKGKLEGEIISVANSQNPQLTKLMLDSDAIKIGMSGELTGDYNSIKSLQIGKLQFGKTDITGRLVMQPFLNAEFKGDSFDLQPVLRYLKNKKDSDDDDSEYRLLLKTDNLILMNGQSLKDAELGIHCAAIGCDTLSLHARNVAIDQTGGALTAKVSEAGNLLNGLGLYENMINGLLMIDAKVAGKNYDGNVTITDFYIVKARVLARMLTLGSLTGIADTVTGKGIRFSKLSAHIQMAPHNLSIENYRMVGPAIGITANGALNRDSNVVAVTGNIIPAYTANTLLGRIPLIGSAIFSDEGVFALAYSMKGNIDNPDLSVNPLTVLAPGALRKIFE